MKEKIFRKMNILKADRGSVTVEATISLTTFMFAVVMVLTIINICMVQAKISIAINDTAKEISQYSYLYALTGINGSRNKLAEAAKENENNINGVISDIGTVYTEVQNLGRSVAEKEGAPDLGGILDNVQSVKESGTVVAGDLEALAQDPKSLAIGLLKILGNDAINLATSRLIAAPIAKGLVQKNLVSEKGGSADQYLKSLRVVNGLDGLDFKKSTLFADGSSEIRINVEYYVKVLPLLPLDIKMHFNQCAVTQGWFTGDESYRTTAEQLEEKENDSIWTRGTIEERSSLIRHQGMKDLIDEGYETVCDKSYQYTQVYSPDSNEFVGINSLNPLYSDSRDRTLTLDDISDNAIREQLEYLCAGIYAQTKDKRTVETKITKNDGSIEKKQYSCTNATQKVILVVPEDEGLKERVEQILETANTNGVTVEVVANYGKGAKTSTLSSNNSEGN